MTDSKKQLSALHKISKKSVALYHRFALSIGVSDSALGVLYALLEAQTPCSQYDLCDAWSIPKQTVNSAVSVLRRRGFISLSPISGTRNKKCIALTDAGRDFVEKTVGRLREAEMQALAVLSPEEREAYVRLNEKYNASLAERIDSFFATDRGVDHPC